MLTLKEAAEQLGYTPSGLYKIINRTRKGKPGAKIQFFQIGKGPIKFRQEWIDSFVAENSIMPVQRKISKCRAYHIEPQWGLAS